MREGGRKEVERGPFCTATRFVTALPLASGVAHRWVKTGVADLWGQMTRLVAAETWQPVSKHDGTARSALELSRLIEVSGEPHAHPLTENCGRGRCVAACLPPLPLLSPCARVHAHVRQVRLSSWLEAACSGSDARRLHVGVLIAACVMHLLYEYMAAAAHAWEKVRRGGGGRRGCGDALLRSSSRGPHVPVATFPRPCPVPPLWRAGQELEVRSSLFTGAPAGAKPANGATPGHRRNPSNQAVDASE